MNDEYDKLKDLINFIKSNYRYNKAEGKLYPRKPVGRQKLHLEAGNIKKGYRTYYFNKKSYSASRIIFLIENKRWPVDLINFRDGNILNTQINNLQEMTVAEKNRHSGVRKDNFQSIKGYTFIKRKKSSHRGRIMLNGIIHYKYSESKEEILNWLHEKRIELHGIFAKD
jgi:hypothetical protein